VSRLSDFSRRTPIGTVHGGETCWKRGRPTVVDVNVVLVRWPVEAARRAELARSGTPRLLLVEGEADAPSPEDCLEDWIRVPAVEADVRARVEGLSTRAGNHGSAAPVLDEHGMLRVGSAWVSLPPVEARITGAMVSRLGAVVRREELAEAGWPDGAPGRNALDVHMLRIRRRLAPLGLAIRTVRSRGYLLEADQAIPGPVDVQAHA
jgi:two-component system OmpR family response regulator